MISSVEVDAFVPFSCITAVLSHHARLPAHHAAVRLSDGQVLLFTYVCDELQCWGQGSTDRTAAAASTP